MISYADEPLKHARAYLADVQGMPASRRTAARRRALISLMVEFPGLYIKEVCCLLGINPRTVKRWAKDPDFGAAYREAQGHRFDKLYAYLKDADLSEERRRTVKCYLFNLDPEYRARMSAILTTRSRLTLSRYARILNLLHR